MLNTTIFFALASLSAAPAAPFAALFSGPFAAPASAPASASGPISGPSSVLQIETQQAGVDSKVIWYGDIETARAVAAKEGKHLFVDFTGTGWCSWCERLKGEVLSKSAFHQRTRDQFVYVALDFDAAGSARRDLPHADANDAWKAKLEVNAFPTVILMTATGKPYATVSYESKGADVYGDKVQAEHTKAARLEELVPKVTSALAAAKAPKDAKAAADDAAVLLRDAGPHALAQPLVPIVQSILKAGELPRKREVRAVAALCSAEVVDDDVLARAFRLDPANAKGLPEAGLCARFNTLEDPDQVQALVERAEGLLRAGPVFDKEIAAHLYGHCAYWSRHWLGDADRARIHARFALQLDPKDDQLRTMLESLAAG